MKRTDFKGLEKAFSDGYEYALEERLYSKNEEKEEKKSKKISFGDRADIWAYKHLHGKKSRKDFINDLDEKEDLLKIAKRHAAKGAKAGLTTGAVIGGSLGYLGSDKNDSKSKKLGKVLAGVGAFAPTGAISGAASAGIGSLVGTAGRRSLRKVWKGYDKSWIKEQDKMKVADGQMSREEYAEKWGK